MFVFGVGIGGIVIGVGYELKWIFLDIEIVVVELMELFVLEGGELGLYKI